MHKPVLDPSCPVVLCLWLETSPAWAPTLAALTRNLHVPRDKKHGFNMHRTHGMIHPSTLTYIVIYARAGWEQSTFGPNLGVRARFLLSSNHSCMPRGRARPEAQGHPDTASFPWSAALNCREFPWVWSQNASVLKRKAEEQLRAIRAQQKAEEQRALCWKNSSAGGQHWKPLAELCEDLAEALTSCMTLSRLSASSLMRAMFLPQAVSTWKIFWNLAEVKLHQHQQWWCFVTNPAWAKLYKNMVKSEQPKCTLFYKCFLLDIPGGKKDKSCRGQKLSMKSIRLMNPSLDFLNWLKWRMSHSVYSRQPSWRKNLGRR